MKKREELNIRPKVTSSVQVGIRITKKTKEHLDYLVKKYNASQALIIADALMRVE